MLMSCEHSCARASCVRACHHHVCMSEKVISNAAVDVHAEIVGPSADDDTRKCREMAGETLEERSVLALQIFSAT